MPSGGRRLRQHSAANSDSDRRPRHPLFGTAAIAILNRGDYPSAVSAYLDYLREEPNGTQRDRALYRLGLAMALPANPSHDPSQAIAYLDQLAADYPKSSLRPEAKLIAALERDTLGLHAEIEQREQQTRRDEP